MKTLITGGRVIDPANRTDAQLNLLIEDGRIARICTDVPEADTVIDASGMVVCPGFIDIHMHEDPVGSDGKIAVSIFECMLRMGVTTAVGGNCGSNACEPSAYFSLCDAGIPVNAALLAGHSYARQAAGVHGKYAPASESQKQAIEDSLRRALQDGCAGISFGLRYVPGTDADEFYRAASAAAGTGKPISAHVRDDADHIFTAIQEMTDCAEKFGLPLQISHIGSMAGFGQMAEVLRRLDALRMNGLDVMLDCYPYNAFSTDLGATTYDDGWLERYGCGYDVLEYCEGELAGKRADAESFARLRESFPDCLTVCHVMRQPDIDLALKHPAVLVGSDGILSGRQGHPRAAGTFPRVFAEYVRRGVLSLNDAIAKMTCLSAQRLHLAGKGTLSVGADADIVIFDPETIRDTATFAEPVNAPEGIRAVLIAGEVALRDGEVINAKLGRAVRVPNR